MVHDLLVIGQGVHDLRSISLAWVQGDGRVVPGLRVQVDGPSPWPTGQGGGLLPVHLPDPLPVHLPTVGTAPPWVQMVHGLLPSPVGTADP